MANCDKCGKELSGSVCDSCGATEVASTIVIESLSEVVEHSRNTVGGGESSEVIEIQVNSQRSLQNQRFVDQIKKVESLSNEKKKTLSEAMADTVLRDDNLELKLPVDWAAMMLALTCYRPEILVDGETKPVVPEKQMKALIKLYGVMKLDPEFEDQDRRIRNETLGKLKVNETVINLKKNWLVGTKDKDGWSRVQSVQTDVLKIEATLDFKSISDGSAGECVGTEVSISDKNDSHNSFDEMLDTVVHETTHAYQNHLVGKLRRGPEDQGLSIDDKAYVQAQIFRMNKLAYFKPPKKPEGPPTKPEKPLETQDDGSDEEQQKIYETKMREYAEQMRVYSEQMQVYKEESRVYKNQPVEMHAWQAGNEAGRLFDVEAAKLEAAKIVQAVASADSAFEEQAIALANIISDDESDNQRRSAAFVKLAELAQNALQPMNALISGLLTNDQLLKQNYLGVTIWSGFDRRRVEIFNDKDLKAHERICLMFDLRGMLEESLKAGHVAWEKYFQVKEMTKDLFSQIDDSADEERSEWRKIAVDHDATPSERLDKMSNVLQSTERKLKIFDEKNQRIVEENRRIEERNKIILAKNAAVGEFNKYWQVFASERAETEVFDQLMQVQAIEDPIERLSSLKSSEVLRRYYKKLCGLEMAD